MIETKYTNKSKKSKNSSRSIKRDEVTRRFHFTHSNTITNGTATSLDMNALEGYSTDFAELSDMYRYFRIDRFAVTGWVDFDAGTGIELLYGLYHTANGATGAPLATALEGKFEMGMGWKEADAAAAAGHNAKLVLGREDLQTITPWFVTLNDASAGADADGPGLILFCQASSITNTGHITWEVDMTITFRTILDPATISAAVEKRVVDRMESEARAKLGKLGGPEYQQSIPPAAAPILRRR